MSYHRRPTQRSLSSCILEASLDEGIFFDLVLHLISI